MCVGIPAEVIKCTEITAIVDISGTQREIATLTLGEELKPGDWVMVHAGFAMAKLDPEEAKRSLQLMLDTVEEVDVILKERAKLEERSK